MKLKPFLLKLNRYNALHQNKVAARIVLDEVFVELKINNMEASRTTKVRKLIDELLH